MKRLLGRLLCRWKGKHVERRVSLYGGSTDVAPYNRECSRCGARRLAPARKVRSAP